MPHVYCVLCGNRGKSVSYHVFPKQEEIRKQWLSFCGIEENILNTVTRLCSNHFREEDLNKKAKGATVKPNVVPSFHTSKRKRLKQADSFVNETNTPKMKCIVADNLNVNGNMSVICDNQPLYCVDVGTSDSSLKEEGPSLSQALNDRSSNPPRDEAIEYSGMQKHAIGVLDPLFVGAISIPHLVTPRRAQKALDVGKRTIAQQQKEIRTLQRAHTRLTARVKTMEDLIKDLKHQNLLSEPAAENLKCTTNTWDNIDSRGANPSNLEIDNDEQLLVSEDHHNVNLSILEPEIKIEIKEEV